MRFKATTNGNVPFTEEEELEADLREAEYLLELQKVKVPQTITPRQLRLALLEATLLDEVEAMVATDRAMGIWWEYSLDIARTNEYIINAGLALSLTEKQIDDLFIGASKL